MAMSESDESSRVFDGEIQEGFRRYFRRETDRNGTPVTSVEVVKRRHAFGEGYRDATPPRSLARDLTPQDARALIDLLEDWLAELEGDRGEEIES